MELNEITFPKWTIEWNPNLQAHVIIVHYNPLLFRVSDDTNYIKI